MEFPDKKSGRYKISIFQKHRGIGLRYCGVFRVLYFYILRYRYIIFLSSDDERIRVLYVRGFGSHLSARSVLLPSAELSTGQPHPPNPFSISLPAGSESVGLLRKSPPDTPENDHIINI